MSIPRLRSVIYDLTATQPGNSVQFYIDGVSAELVVIRAGRNDLIDGIRAASIINEGNEVPVVQRWPVVYMNGIAQVYDQRIIVTVSAGSEIRGYLRVFYLS